MGAAASACHGDAGVHLQRCVVFVPFVKSFMGSPASGFQLFLFLPTVRIAAAEFYMTNAVGEGPLREGRIRTRGRGLRTLAGGQLSFQVQGYLAIQTAAAPPWSIEDAHVASRYFRGGAGAPSGGAISCSCDRRARPTAR